jgi:hypothetical protein
LKDATNILFRTHAIQRMFQRNISEKDVRSILMKGETIEEYAEDTPYPSRLILGWIGQRPIHVVTANNDMDNEIIVITVYEPDRGKWSDDFKRRTI